MAGVLTEETNILGLPSLTGLTPLKARQQNQILKYNFKGIGPLVVDKSGNFNRGILHGPKREVISIFPLKMAISCDGEDDYVVVPTPNTVSSVSSVTASVKMSMDTEVERYRHFLSTTHANEEVGYDFSVYRGELHFAVNDGTLGGMGERVTAPLDPGGHLVKGSYDDETGELMLSVDQEVVDSRTISIGSIKAAKRLFIGARREDYGFTKCKIENVQIFDQPMR